MEIIANIRRFAKIKVTIDILTRIFGIILVLSELSMIIDNFRLNDI